HGRSSMRLSSLCLLIEAVFLSSAILYLTSFPAHRCVYVQSAPSNFHACGQILKLSAPSTVQLRLETLNRSHSLAISRSEGKVCEPENINILSTDFFGMRYVEVSLHALYLSLLLLSVHTLLSLVQICCFPLWTLRASCFFTTLFHSIILTIYYLAHYALAYESKLWSAQEKS
ncbi:hypothetical protein PMAYCL1PPCAC_17491, partial [Pristionchus mayeri]